MAQNKSNNNETFGDAIATIRRLKGMTLEQMGEFLGVTSSVISDLEYGRRPPSIKKAAELAQKLDQNQQVLIRLAINDNLRRLGLDLHITPSGLKSYK